MVLPTEKTKATAINPKTLVIFSKPKTGKSSMLAELPNNLIIDLENGTDYLESLRVKANTFEELYAIIIALKKGHTYDYITIDTITKLEELVLPYAKKLYQATPMGKSFDSRNEGVSVLTLPNGAGYLYLRQAFMKIINAFQSLTKNLILVGHLKDTFIEKDGKEVTGKELDLTGEIYLPCY